MYSFQEIWTHESVPSNNLKLVQIVRYSFYPFGLRKQYISSCTEMLIYESRLQASSSQGSALVLGIVYSSIKDNTGKELNAGFTHLRSQAPQRC